MAHHPVVKAGSANQPRHDAACELLTNTPELAGATMPFERNAEIFGEGEPAEYVYKVVSGAVRTYRVLNDGRRQVGAFYLPGDVFGLELGEEHAGSAEAVVNSKVLFVRRNALMQAITPVARPVMACCRHDFRVWWQPDEYAIRL